MYTNMCTTLQHLTYSIFVYFLVCSMHKFMGCKHRILVNSEPDVVRDDVMEQGDPRGVWVGRPLISGHSGPDH